MRVASSWSRAMSWISRTSLSACCSVLVISRMIAWDFILDSICRFSCARLFRACHCRSI